MLQRELAEHSRGSRAVPGAVPRRGHLIWTCQRLLCACPAAPAVPLSPQCSQHRFHFSSPHHPRPHTLSISLFFSSPFASFSCWLSRFEASRPPCLCTLLSTPDICRLPAAPLHPPLDARHNLAPSRWGTEGPSWSVEELSSIVLLPPTASIAAGLLGFASQNTIRAPSNLKYNSSSCSCWRRFWLHCPTTFPWDAWTWVSSGGPEGIRAAHAA